MIGHIGKFSDEDNDRDYKDKVFQLYPSVFDIPEPNRNQIPERRDENNPDILEMIEEYLLRHNIADKFAGVSENIYQFGGKD
jgi:hypothetical protein